MAVALGLVAALSGPGWTLKTLERVKGIEPSYSAWKAAALPLSYTRAGLNRVDPAVAAGDELTRPASGLNSPREGHLSRDLAEEPATRVQGRPLTSDESVPILLFPSTMKGGDPVSFTKRCHLAGIAR